jgi:hypothetical protein
MVRPLDEVNDVFAALEAGSVVGRAVLQVADDAVRVPDGVRASDIVGAS